MTRDDDFIGQLEGYLDEYEGMTPLPGAVRDAIRAELPSTRQIGPATGLMRDLNMSMKMSEPVRYGLVAAVVVVAVVLGVSLLGRGPDVGGEPESPTESSQPTSSPSSSATSSVSALPDGVLLPGTYSVRPQDISAPRIRLTVPAGWYGAGFSVSKHNSIDAPDGAGVILWGGPFNVYEDPCGWSTSLPSSPTGPSVDELVTALAAQPMRDATAATDITLDGYSGKALELTVPADLGFDAATGFADCDEGGYRSWISPDGLSFREHQAPGQHDRLWVIDVEGTRVVIDATFYAGTSASDTSELQAILDSIGFEP
jgi:hypothetical protein